MGSEQSCNKREREPAATPRDVRNALEQQRQMYERKMQQLLEEKQRQANATVAPLASQVNSLSMGQQAARTELLERQRSPYSYNQSDLNSPRDLSSGLYPNLNSPGCSTPQGSVSFPGQTTYGPGYGTARYTTSYQYQQQTSQQPAQRNVQPQPSAPPSDSSSTNSRSRSQSRPRSADADVNCLTCGKMYGERIYQCNVGHSSCETCKTRQAACGRCKLQLTDRRNYELEKYLMERRVKCPNSADGCRLFIKMGDIATHEKECPFKALQCPSLGTCTWQGKLSQLSDHFNEMHPLHNQGEVDKEMSIHNVTNTSHTMHYVRIGNFNFLFHIKVSESDARIYMAIQLLGTKYSAAKWDYEVQMYNKSQPRRKYQYSDTCSSASEPLQDIINATKCAVIPIEYAKTFLCGGVVNYKFYIKRDDFKTYDNANNNTEDVRRGPPTRRNFKKFANKKNINS